MTSFSSFITRLNCRLPDSYNGSCLICFDPLEDGRVLAAHAQRRQKDQAAVCHLFHKVCIKNQQGCPTCREPLKENVSYFDPFDLKKPPDSLETAFQQKTLSNSEMMWVLCQKNAPNKVKLIDYINEKMHAGTVIHPRILGKAALEAQILNRNDFILQALESAENTIDDENLNMIIAAASAVRQWELVVSGFQQYDKASFASWAINHVFEHAVLWQNPDTLTYVLKNFSSTLNPDTIEKVCLNALESGLVRLVIFISSYVNLPIKASIGTIIQSFSRLSVAEQNKVIDDVCYRMAPEDQEYTLLRAAEKNRDFAARLLACPNFEVSQECLSSAQERLTNGH